MAAPMKIEKPKGSETRHLYDRANFADRKIMRYYMENIRLCDYYSSEYKDCTGRVARRYQRYVYGDELECEHYNRYFKTCQKFKTTGDEDALEELVDYEEKKMEHRLQNARNNDVWEYRLTPPADWNNPVAQSEQTNDSNDSKTHSVNSDKNASLKGDNNKSVKTEAVASPVTVPGTQKSSGWCSIS